MKDLFMNKANIIILFSALITNCDLKPEFPYAMVGTIMALTGSAALFGYGYAATFTIEDQQRTIRQLTKIVEDQQKITINNDTNQVVISKCCSETLDKLHIIASEKNDHLIVTDDSGYFRAVYDPTKKSLHID